MREPAGPPPTANIATQWSHRQCYAPLSHALVAASRSRSREAAFGHLCLLWSPTSLSQHAWGATAHAVASFSCCAALASVHPSGIPLSYSTHNAFGRTQAMQKAPGLVVPATLSLLWSLKSLMRRWTHAGAGAGLRGLHCGSPAWLGALTIWPVGCGGHPLPRVTAIHALPACLLCTSPATDGTAQTLAGCTAAVLFFSRA